jgi:hypothetical protein
MTILQHSFYLPKIGFRRQQAGRLVFSQAPELDRREDGDGA